MKKKIMFVLVIIGIIGFSVVNAGGRWVIAKEQQDLLTLVSVLKGENIDINGWSLHAREKWDTASLEDVQKEFQHLKKKFPSWEWMVTSDSKKWEATAKIASSQGYQENIQILSTLTQKNPQTYIIYEVQGKNFTQKTEQFIKEELTTKLSDIFRENTTIFSCIKGEFNDKMNTTLPFTVKNLLETFQAKEIESINEPNFVSTSAYSPLFADGIKTNKNDMNLQLGIRTQGLGAKTTLVVGTPIITIEY